MTSATVGGTTTTFAYRGDGLRNSRTTGGSTTTFTWDANAGLPVVLDDGNQYVYGAGLAEMVTGGSTYYYLADGLGSTMAMVDTSGTVQKSYTYDVYGKPTATGSLGNEYDFAGQETDGTGLQYLRARYMDPETGRFMSRDPMAAAPAWGDHPFGYAGGSPASSADPTGLWCVWKGCVDHDGVSFGGHEIVEGAKAVSKALEDLGKWTVDQIAEHPVLFISLLQSAVLLAANIACASPETGIGVAACVGLIATYITLTGIKIKLIRGEYDRGDISNAEATCKNFMSAPLPFPYGQIGNGICASIHILDQLKAKF